MKNLNFSEMQTTQGGNAWDCPELGLVTASNYDSYAGLFTLLALTTRSLEGVSFEQYLEDYCHSVIIAPPKEDGGPEEYFIDV